MKEKVLLTGISGFLGSHTAIQLLEKGYQVIGTMRNLDRAESIKKLIGTQVSNTENLSFVQAELSDEKIWQTITKGIDYIQHIASPFPRELPKHENDLILPAKNGMLNILKAASYNQVKRVVITSSSSAVLYGKPKGQQSGTFDETTWTDIRNHSDTTPYFRSKTLAEKAAWEFMEKDQSGMELVAVLPGAILGPVLEDDFGTSANIILKMLDSSMPAVPKIGFDLVDVRSVADMLIRAMEIPEAAGERFLSSAGFLSFSDISAILRANFPERKIPKKLLPDFITKILGLFDKSLAPVLLDLGIERKVNGHKAMQMLQWEPKQNKEAVIACAESLIKLGLVK